MLHALDTAGFCVVSQFDAATAALVAPLVQPTARVMLPAMPSAPVHARLQPDQSELRHTYGRHASVLHA